jgi:RND family efflux transporter MFP subunit
MSSLRVATLALLLGAALFPSCRPAPAPESAPAESLALPVTVTAVRFSGEALPVESTGILASREETELAFKIGGVVAEVAVRSGDAVPSGHVLARLKRDEIEAEVAQARAALEKARRDQERARRLAEEQVITREQAQNADTAVEQSEAALRAAEFNWRFAVIEAPAAGRILRRLAEPGQLVNGGRPILVFAPDDAGWLARVGVAANDFARLAIGDRAELQVAGTDQVFPGVIRHRAGGADAVLRTGEVEIEPEGRPTNLLAGVVVHARLFPRPVAVRPVVPASALVEGRGARAALFLLKPDSAAVQKVAVDVEVLAGADAFLRTPLPSGARVVTGGAEYLREEMAVRVTETTATNTPPNPRP